MNIFLRIFGLAVFFGLMSYALKAQAYRWRLLASSYASRVRRPARAVRRIESFIATGGGWGWASYAGVRIEVGQEGLSLRLLPLFAAFSPPLFLPFAEMKVEPTHWYLNVESFAITMARADAVRIIVSEDLLTWIRDHSTSFPGQQSAPSPLPQ